MHPKLRTEITAYQLCVFDDGIQESPHALVSRVVASARVSGPPWWSATIRMQQNFGVQKQLATVAGPLRFDRLFHSWKMLGQTKWYRYQQCIPKWQKTQVFLEMVYRTGEHNRCDWQFLATYKTRQPITVSLAEVAATQEVKADFIRRACPSGTFITFPRSSFIGSLEGIARSLPPGGQHSVDIEPVCFQVVSHDVTAKKFVDTESTRAMRRMQVPAVVQTYDPWNMASFPCERLDVYTDGRPMLIDLGHWVNFSVHKQLCQWITRTSDVEGCWEMTDPRAYVNTQWSSIKDHGH